MPRNSRWSTITLLLLSTLLLTACARALADETGKIEPARLEPVPGTEFNRVVLTERAAERLGVKTDVIREVEMNGETVLVAPYASILYGLKGETWLYINPEPLTYQREVITVDYIEDDLAILKEGPPAGTAVVTVAVAQLFGTDTGVGK